MRINIKETQGEAIISEVDMSARHPLIRARFDWMYQEANVCFSVSDMNEVSSLSAGEEVVHL